MRAWQAWAPHATSKLGLSVCVLSSGRGVSVGGQFFGSPRGLQSLIRPLMSTGHPSSGPGITQRSFFDAVLLYAGCDSVAACHRVQREAFKAKSDYVRRPLSKAAVRTIVRGLDHFSAGSLSVILDSYGGAINKVPAGATAFAHRDMLYSIQYYATPGSHANIAALNGFYHAMRPYVSGQAYVNYVDPQQPNWLHAYYGKNLKRLVSIKRKHDPSNFFHFKQSIPRRL